MPAIVTWRLRVESYPRRLIAEFGGAAGVRDEGLLDSAWSRPRNLFAYERPSILDLAASLAFRLIKNHPFLDGNKRVAFTAAVTFLHVNGRRVHATEVDATVRTLALATGDMTEPEYARLVEGQLTDLVNDLADRSLVRCSMSPHDHVAITSRTCSSRRADLP